MHKPSFNIGWSGAALLLCGMLTSLPAAAQARAWNFQVMLDDSPIGYHRFALNEQGGAREMKIEARFNVKVLFINAYQYAHDATERWRGNCLDSISARTDDNGEKLTVEAARDGERLAVTTVKGKQALDGCVMTFAYWNPEILRQPRLLNSQTGEYEAVKITQLPDENVTVRGAPVMARHYRITGPKNPIELWYSASDEWLALDSTVAGGRKLRYRIEK
jgi:hypothetical protein